MSRRLRSGVLLSSGRYVHFGPFRIDQQRQEVTRDGSRLKLQGKVYQVLLTLLEKPGEVVTPRRVALPALARRYARKLRRQTSIPPVNKLRQALGDSTDKPLYIETIPRKGYCLWCSRKSPTSPLSNRPQTSLPLIPFETRVPLSFSKSDVWVVLGVIGLILAGMLLGAGITRLWHVAPTAPYPLSMIFFALINDRIFLRFALLFGRLA